MDAPTKSLKKLPSEPAEDSSFNDLGWLEHGSTIIVLLPEHITWAEGIQTGVQIEAGTVTAHL